MLSIFKDYVLNSIMLNEEACEQVIMGNGNDFKLKMCQYNIIFSVIVLDFAFFKEVQIKQTAETSLKLV